MLCIIDSLGRHFPIIRQSNFPAAFHYASHSPATCQGNYFMQRDFMPSLRSRKISLVPPFSHFQFSCFSAAFSFRLRLILFRNTWCDACDVDATGHRRIWLYLFWWFIAASKKSALFPLIATQGLHCKHFLYLASFLMFFSSTSNRRLQDSKDVEVISCFLITTTIPRLQHYFDCQWSRWWSFWARRYWLLRVLQTPLLKMLTPSQRLDRRPFE